MRPLGCFFFAYIEIITTFASSEGRKTDYFVK